MTTLLFGELKPYATRRFLPTELAPDTWSKIEPWFDRLAATAASCHTATQLENWLLDWSELKAVTQEETARRYIRMTCDTADQAAETAHLDWVRNVAPRLKARNSELARLFVAHPARAALPAERYRILNRQLETEVHLFRAENLPLETADAEIRQRYQKRCGAQTVSFRGQDKTMAQLMGLLKEPDRDLREAAWTAQAHRRLADAPACETDFDEMVRLRTRIATQAGFANYRDYAFRLYNRFDYTPQTCLDFHAAIESEVMPALRALQEKRRRQLQLPALRPWDLAVDPLNQAALKPFASANELVEKTTAIFTQIDPELGAHFDLLRTHGLLDLADRPGKAPGGYCYPLGETRLPFIFMNAVGTERDVSVLLHEGGHALHDIAAQAENLHSYRQAPMEFCEVAAMSMELLGSEHYDAFYAPADARRAQRELLEGILKLLPWMAQIDAFQHWIYTHPEHTVAERTACWVQLMHRFGDPVDWTGFEAVHDQLWHRLPHPFLYPFYYIEYGLAQIGALHVWRNARTNRPNALRAFKASLALGASRPLPELFATAGATFDFSATAIRPLVQLVTDQLAALDD